jgi:hypothetical protein
MIHIIGGGTFSHVRSHLALAAPAFGKTACEIYNISHDVYGARWGELEAKLHLTKMADPHSKLVTNHDVAALIDALIANPKTRVIYMNAALCDYDGHIQGVPGLYGFEATPSGKYETRLKTSEGNQPMLLVPADKIISRIRKTRKDIFLVAFKTTSGATSDEQYAAGLNLLKANSANLVLANDIVTRNNMIIAPEETRYNETTNRAEVLRGLVEMVHARSQNTFTRSTVVPGDLVDFQTDAKVPDNLREVVNHLVQRGAYKPFRGATVGHFAVRVDDKRCLTSRRKTNYTAPHGLDLVEIEYDGLDKVIAHGAKPSVGGQSQRIVFDQNPDLDCIVHAHVPLKSSPRDQVPVADQWQNECGSHQCGQNTSENLREFADLKAVMLDDHGPNIVFSRNTPAAKVIEFIEANFDLEAKTGGLVA